MLTTMPLRNNTVNGGSSPAFCCPSLDCSLTELVTYIKSMKGGERVIEMGGSCMIGETGTVELRGAEVCIRWDTKFVEGSGMVTSFTGGARIIQGNVQRLAHADEKLTDQKEAP